MRTQQSASCLLTIIIPLRWSGDRHDAIDRLAYVLHDTDCPEEIDFLVVDDGSPAHTIAEIKRSCAELGFRYVRIDSELETFSIGRARNFGTQSALSKYVMFQDTDLMPYPGFYRDVVNEIKVQKLDEYAERFLMFGVIYLTPAATEEYMSTPVSLRKSQFTQYLLDDDRTKIEKFSTGTSVTVWRRDYFLCAGGNDPDFEGWGYEDLEFMCRALRRAVRFPLPEEFSLDYRNFQSISEYRGWKSIYRLFGDITFQKGIVLFHAWHPVEANGSYIKAKDRNRKLFERKLEAFRARGEEPEPLPMPERGRSLLFRKNPWVYNRWTAPFLGEIVYVDEELLHASTVLDFIRENGISRVVFHNPYANEWMRNVFEAVKCAKIEFLICERGALPDSIFFDANGFNGLSSSYHPGNWARELSRDERQCVADYVKDFKMTGNSLEGQPDRIGARRLRTKLGLAPNAKVLFVPLQRPSDTVIEYLSSPIGGYDQFIQMVRRLTYTLPPNWVVVAKTHPLEVDQPDLGGVVYADDSHINDLVEMADSILLINSGVGLTGLIYGKPVMYAGTAFYGHEGLAAQVSSHEDVLNKIRNFKPDPERTFQFLHYLLKEFYSFGKFKTRTVPWKDGALMTATTGIDFNAVRIPGCPPLTMERRERVLVGENSILFDRYRGIDGNIRRKPAIATPHATKPSGAPAKASAPVNDLNHSKREKRQKNGFLKKIKKLRENPVMFLRDSRFNWLKNLGYFIKKK